ncbi:sensor histidine kinase [Streptomyces kunmingensis]|uniref:histidine kinase n=1 Tax=Streptomyces kunmingensis TaxID=68225 RepID=A0ABU6CFK5_9ACTN|nr:sensor histidine kinase [Streptomyces kunmingensis]MEB3963488.1 sensor histidine kinase [Streptomyces kunmingensis]
MTWTRAVSTAARRLLTHPDLPLMATCPLTLAALTEVLAPAQPAPTDPLGPLALALAATLPLAFLRSQPLLSAISVTAAVLLAPPTYDRIFYSGLPALAAVLYVVGRRQQGRTAVLFALPFAAYALTDGHLGVPLLIGTAAALTAGHAHRTRTENTRRSAADRSYTGTVLAHAALGERARIARELHDIVAHHVSTISVQSETARFTTPGLTAEGAAAFLAIGDTARLALTEMRRLLGVLREDAPEATAPPARAPQPGLDQLVALVDEAREAADGAVRLIVRGPVTTLDPGLELTAYRIVQEALTNARRHARGGAVDVELHYTEAELTLRIRDCGPGDGKDGTEDNPGYGLLGMRERTTMAGGTLRAGQGPAGGFLVEAALPIRAGSHPA